MFFIVAAFWLWDVFAGKNNFMPQRRPLGKYWVVPLAFIAFWFPINADTFLPDFAPMNFLTNVAGLTFCMMTTVYLAILILYYPQVNMATMRVTSIVGTIIGFYNIMISFVENPTELWWYGILHIPLFIVSLYSFILSF